MKNNDHLNKSSAIENRIAIKELVDIFSILADQKEVQKQTELFTENENVKTYFNGLRVASLNG